MENHKNAVLDFIYNIDEKTIDLSDALSTAYGMTSHFDNMPYSFAEAYVHEDDIEQFNQMYFDMDEGAQFATADFRIKSPGSWSRVCLFRPDFSKPLVSGIVQNVSERYDAIIAEAERKEKEINLRISKEMEALQLVRAVSESSDIMVSVNLTRDNYYVISDKTITGNEIPSDGTYDDIFSSACSYVTDEFIDEFVKNFNKENLLRAYANDEKYVYMEHKRLEEDGLEHWTSTHFMFTDNPYNDDIIAIVVRRNIDRRKIVEEQYKEDLANALLSAKQANNAKSDFLSQMSHDIRTPMNAIVGFTDFAIKEDDISVIKNDYLPKIQTSSKHLLMLINDVLEMSRIESGKIELTENACHLGEVSRDITYVVLNQAKEKELKLRSIADVNNYYVYCDTLRFNQVVTNLLSNAVKFTQKGGTITVAFKQEDCGEEGYSFYELKVSDTGIGMSPEFAQKVFEPFERERTSTVSGMEGTGLGLAIVKNIVEAMNGTISVESEVGVGTTFSVRLKLRHVEPEVVKAMQENTQKEKTETTIDNMKEHFMGKRLLLVEDNELNRMIAETILSEAGFIIEQAEDGTVAVEMVKDAPTPYYYDAIIMDIQMPIMNGYEATKIIRQMEDERRNVKIIAVTANAFESDVQEAKNAGMNAHVSKPINPEEVYKALLKEIR